VEVKGVKVDGRPLDEANSRALFKNNTFFTEGGATFVAFDPENRDTVVEIL
jgi:hypothetical protein